MSDLLINWLNDQVQLSRRIINFQEDFHNGYLFGQLLSKYSQQLNFSEFIDRDEKVSRISNFTLLYDTFKTLRVSYDSNIAMAIIEKKTGIAKKVLYELKMQLEKTTSNAFSKLNRPVKPLSPLKKIPISKEKFDKISKEHFSKQLNEMHRAQKSINIDQHLSKFPEFQQKTLMKAQHEERKESQAKLLGQMKMREKQLDNIKKSAQFRNQWEQSNLSKWAANLTIRRAQVEKDTLFKTSLQNTKMQNKTMSELNAIKLLDKDIKQFEKKVKADRPRRDSSSESEEEVPVQKKSILLNKSLGLKNRELGHGTKGQLSQTLNQQIDTKKRSPHEIETNRHQRQKRRRKMIVEQGKKHQLIKVERRQRYIISTLEQNSRQEKEIQYEIWRAWQNKEIIIQNRQAMDEKVKEKEETRAINATFKDEELIKTYREEHAAEVTEGVSRQNKLKVRNSVENRKLVYNQCRTIMDSFVAMAQVLYQYGQQKNEEDLDPIFVGHLLDEFARSLSSDREIAELELENYVKGKGEWDIAVPRESEQVISDPCQDNALPKQVINNFYLGNILKQVFSELYHEATEKQRDSESGNPHNLIALLGLDFAGKSTVALKLKQTFGFDIIRINQLIENKIEDYKQMEERGQATEGETRELIQLCSEGKPIPNHIILSVLKQEVSKRERCIIVNYPTTYGECLELTKQLGNQQPSDCTRKSKLSTKIQQFSRLVRPTQIKYIPRSLKPCGIDFALWIEVSPRTSLDRFLGRRWTPNGECVHINSDISRPNELEVGDKASPMILRNNFKLQNKGQIEAWLKQFGIKVGENDQQLIQLCWQSISGEDSEEKVAERVLRTVERAIGIKERKNTQLRHLVAAQQQENKKIKEREQSEVELKDKCAYTEPESINVKFQQAIESVTTDPTFLNNIESLWNTTEKLTVSSLVSVFQALRQQQVCLNKHISETKKKFIRMLTREDARFYLTKKFQNDYNEFFDENSDMLSKEYAKEELHQKVEDLEVDLLTIVEEKKDDATSERESIMNSGWLERQLSQIIASAHVLLQTELNRSFSCQQIIQDYYSKQCMVPAEELEQQTQLELCVDETLDVIKDGTFPKLDKLVSEAMRLFNKEEDTDDKNKKGKKAPPAKKEDKKAAKKGGKEEVEEKKELTQSELQFKRAINTEKAIFRYRVKMIHSYIARKLRELHEAGNRLYLDLEDLLLYNDQVEKASVADMTRIFRDSIEQEAKIENQVQINYIQVRQTQLIRNFEKPKPVIEPAMESARPSRFTVSSLKEIMKFLSSEAELKQCIQTRRMLSVFEQLHVNEHFRVHLPETWKHLSSEQHQNFINRFDPQMKGEIQVWIIFQIMCLSSSSLPNAEALDSYQLLLSDHNPNFIQVGKEKLINLPAWFDSQEPVAQNIHTFERNRHIKSMLFDIHKHSESDLVNLNKYIRRLSLRDYVKVSEKEQTYFEFAFE